MGDYEKEKWVGLYKSALLELEHSLIEGRIADARAGIVQRVEKLRDIPGLHERERQAIEDALSSLRILEREELRNQAEQQKHAAETALAKLRQMRPEIENA